VLLPRDFFARPSVEVAPDLLGCVLEHETAEGLVAVRLTEVEAYAGASDPASHAWRGRTARNAVMFGPPGHVYVYRSYGIHWCMNLVCAGPASAVLIRAIEPTHGLDVMIARRGLETPRLLCSGPGRLCQAMGVSHAQNGARIDAPPFDLLPGAAAGIVVGPRIGISKAVEAPWRFGEAGSRFLSRPFPRP